mmetsp:Transcript_105639/g.158140  ORF Transcript_105639/g.158140 Transcript_105639/m.158140 type:complete len:90 (-) Transcript_105639:207-476(-)
MNKKVASVYYFLKSSLLSSKRFIRSHNNQTQQRTAADSFDHFKDSPFNLLHCQLFHSAAIRRLVDGRGRDLVVAIVENAMLWSDLKQML